MRKQVIASVTDKRHLEQVGRLVEVGWEVVSTGGTADELRRLGIRCTPVEEVTGFPEILGGRVKTLHPKIFGGILARRDMPAHMDVIAEHGILPTDLLCGNLYDFKASPSIEQIDIGGPSLLRAAAKNGASVGVIIDPEDYAPVFDELLGTGSLSERTREDLVMKVFEVTSEYDRLILEWMKEQREEGKDFLIPPPVTGH